MGQPRTLRGLLGLRGPVCSNHSRVCVLVLPGSTFFLAGVPLPLLEMGKAINGK